MKKILLLLVFLHTILFSVTQTEIADTSYFRVNKDSGGCGACTAVSIPSDERPSYIDFPQSSFCGTMSVPTGYTWDSCRVDYTYTAGICEEGENGRDSDGNFIWACSIPYSYVPKYTLTYHCQKLDLPIEQRPLSSDGVTPMEINPDTCEWIEPCTTPTDRTLSSYSTLQECQNAVTNLSSIYPDLASSLYCHTCDPDGGHVTMYQRTVTCSDGTSPVSTATSGGALVCVSDENIDNCVKDLSENQRLIRGVADKYQVGYKEYFDWGYLTVVESDPICSLTVVDMFYCPINKFYDKNSSSCVSVPNRLNADSDCSTYYDQKKFYDFSTGINYIPQWLDDLGAVNNHCYWLYACSSDPLVMNLKEVSCSKDRDDYQKTELEITPSDNNDSNVSDSVITENLGTTDTGNLDSVIAGNLKEINDKLGKMGTSVVGLGGVGKSLEKINNKLDGKDENGTDEDISEFTGNFSQGDSILSQIEDSFLSVADSYQGVLSGLESGFDLSLNSGSGSFVLETDAFNRNIRIDMCPILSTFAPIFYYIFYLTFLFTGVKLFYLGFRII